MNILISVCEAFLLPVKVMLYSLSQHNDALKIYIFYSSLTSEQIEDLSHFVQYKCKGALYPISADGYFKDVPLSKQYGKSELYYRLLAPYILPKELDRILYMDADMIVNASIDEFYNQEFDGAYAAVIKDRFDFCDEVVAQKKKLGMKPEDIYFNSGMMLFNLRLFRENISIDDIMNFIDEKRDVLFYFDQDILNCLLLDHKKLCDEKYNFQAYPFEDLKINDIENVSVLHYTDQPKPWDIKYPGKISYFYWSNLLKAGFIDEYLKFLYDREY